MRVHAREHGETNYYDIDLYFRPFPRQSDAEWKRRITYSKGDKFVYEEEWLYSTNDTFGFGQTEHCPPVEVLREYSRQRELAMQRFAVLRLKGTI